MAYSRTLQDHYVQNESFIIYISSMLSSQGMTTAYRHMFRRITTLTGYLLVVIIVSVYAAQLYIVILTPPKDPFEGLADLLNSDILLARHSTYGVALLLFVSFLFALIKIKRLTFETTVRTPWPSPIDLTIRNTFIKIPKDFP